MSIPVQTGQYPGGNGAPIYTFYATGPSDENVAIYNVWDFVQQSDGAAPDNMIARAIAAASGAGPGGRVYLPRGQYSISTPIVVNADNVEIVGDGWSTVITPSATFPTGQPMIQVQAPGGAGNFRYGVAVRDLFLNGNNVAGVGGIQLNSTYYALLQHVRIRFCPGIGVDLQGASNAFGAYSKIIGCTITDGGSGTALQTNNHEWNTIRDTTIAWYQSAGGIGLYLQNGNNVITGNTFDECETGIYMNFTHNETIVGNQFDRGRLRFIYFHGAEFTRVSNNYFGTFAGTGSQYMLVVDGGSSNFRNIIEANQASSYGTQWFGWVSEGGGLGSPGNLYLNNETLGLAVTLNNGTMRGNSGYNPRGHAVAQPPVPATGVAQTNTTGVDCDVCVSGGTVTAIALGGTNTGLTSGAFRVPAGQTITLTYSVAPTWQWYGD